MIISRNFPGGTEKNYGKRVRRVDLRFEHEYETSVLTI